ncbi:MAG: single-stranded DNA-binding protein [Bacteroidetes bacterium]|nr:single-stranded DNA-binding protein [Bacteroidota bacterium]
MINKVFLIGRLGKDPVIKHFQNDSAIAEFTLATDDSYKDKQGNKVEQTDWHNIKMPFKWQAEIAEKYLKKGGLIHIEGKIKTRSYDDKDGNKRYITEVVVESFKMLDSKKDSGGYSQSSSAPSSEDTPVASNTSSASSAVEDDLPF